MLTRISAEKRTEWLRRYLPAEILATTTALAGAWAVYIHTGSYVTATAAGWIGEGIGFYGYFITRELLANRQRYSQYPLPKRIAMVIAATSANLTVEFLPAELLDNFLIRPFLMYVVPQHIHPYPVGFLVGKFAADIVFYAISTFGYEARKRFLKH